MGDDGKALAATTLSELAERLSEGHTAECGIYERCVCDCGYDRAVFDIIESASDAAEEITRLTEGSAWRRSIQLFLFEAVADDQIRQVVDQQVQFRMQELLRTEEAYQELRKRAPA